MFRNHSTLLIAAVTICTATIARGNDRFLEIVNLVGSAEIIACGKVQRTQQSL